MVRRNSIIGALFHVIVKFTLGDSLYKDPKGTIILTTIHIEGLASRLRVQSWLLQEL